jgi:hypothetical protein
MKHTLIPMAAHEVLTAIHRGKNALVNVEGPCGRFVVEDGESRREWKALASNTPDGLFSCATLAPFLTGEQVYFSLSSIYRAPWHKYTSTVTGLTVYSRDELQYLNCVCADIDAHGDGEHFDFDSQVQQVLDFTLTAGLPYPSMMSDSGRGLWLFWLLKDRLNQSQPVGAWRNLQVFHSRLLSAAVAAYRKFNSGTDASCTDSQRVARFPGSINSKSGTAARYFRTSDQSFTMPELADGFGVKARKTVITTSEAQISECTGKTDCKCGGQRFDDAGNPKKPVCLTMRAQAGLMRWRTPLSGLRKLAEIRGRFKKGQRNTAVYLFVSIGKRARVTKLQLEAALFADQHCPGLELSDIRKCVKAARKNWKHISNAKIIEMLKITDAERVQLAFWLKPPKTTKEAEIAFRRSVLAAEISLHGPLSIRKAVYVLSKHGISIGRSQIAEDLRSAKNTGRTSIAGRAIPLRGENQPKKLVPENPACL